MQLSKNFTREEFDCKDGTDVPVELLPNLERLVIQLQILRDLLKEPVRVISGYRTESHNKAIGGAVHSQHLLAKAADITIKSKTSFELKDFIEKQIKKGVLHFGGIGLYPGFVHVDIRDGSARW